MTNVSLQRFAGLSRRFLVSLGLGIGLLTAGAIAPPPSPTPNEATRAPSPPAQSVMADYSALAVALDATEPFLETANEANAANLLNVTVYTPNSTCEEFQAQEQAIAADKAVAQIVHLLLASQTDNLVNFELSGYRIRSEAKNNSVTVDFRRAPEAQRLFVSLSMCEQLALFGSLRKTLLENPALNIDSVRFTERGSLIQI